MATRSREQNAGQADAAAVIAAIATRFGINVLYAFGSRAREAFAQTIGRGTFAAGGVSDLDLAALPAPGRVWNVDERVLMTMPVLVRPWSVRPHRHESARVRAPAVSRAGAFPRAKLAGPTVHARRSCD